MRVLKTVEITRQATKKLAREQKDRKKFHAGRLLLIWLMRVKMGQSGSIFVLSYISLLHI